MSDVQSLFRRLRVVAITTLALAVSVAVVEPTARACGTWKLVDHEREQTAHFFLHSMQLQKKGSQKRPVVMRIKDDKDGNRIAVRRGKRFLDVVDGQLRRRGKVIAAVKGDMVAFKNRSFRVSLSPKTHPSLPKFFKWWVEVHDGEQLIASGHAMSLCHPAQRGSPQAEQREIRERVVYYLGFRGFKR